MVIFAINSPKVRYFTNCSVSHAPKRSAKTTKCAKGSLPVCFGAVSVFSMGAIAFIIPPIVSRLSLNVNILMVPLADILPRFCKRVNIGRRVPVMLYVQRPNTFIKSLQLFIINNPVAWAGMAIQIFSF